MADFAALDLDTLRKLAADERMGPAQQERIAARIAELAQAPEPPGESPCSLTREVKPGKRRGKQNLTETRAFKDLIAPRIAAGEIARAEFEGATWHVHEVAKYTPDWLCWMPPDCGYLIWNIEVKGRHIREKDVIRFKANVAARPWMRWTLVQWEKRRWKVRFDKQPTEAS